jgi:hypothetical protein
VSDPTSKSDQFEDDDILYSEPSDEALELAAGTLISVSETISSSNPIACTHNPCCHCLVGS